MIETKDLESIQKICMEIESLGFRKPRVEINDITGQISNIMFSTSKYVSRTPEETTE
jgi:hypothetical protein